MVHEKQKELLQAIWNYQLKSPLYFHTDCNDTNFKGDKLVTDVLPPKMRGLYWLWTDYGFDELEQLTHGNSDNDSEVKINELTKQRKCLVHLCREKRTYNQRIFRLVYNGRGRLRKRILQEFRANSPGTGTLNLLNRKWVNSSNNDENHVKNWAVTFFNFDGEEEKELIQKVLGKGNFNLENFYNNYASSLEINWRVNYGVPILSRL